MSLRSLCTWFAEGIICITKLFFYTVFINKLSLRIRSLHLTIYIYLFIYFLPMELKTILNLFHNSDFFPHNYEFISHNSDLSSHNSLTSLFLAILEFKSLYLSIYNIYLAVLAFLILYLAIGNFWLYLVILTILSLYLSEFISCSSCYTEFISHNYCKSEFYSAKVAEMQSTNCEIQTKNFIPLLKLTTIHSKVTCFDSPLIPAENTMTSFECAYQHW